MLIAWPFQRRSVSSIKIGEFSKGMPSDWWLNDALLKIYSLLVVVFLSHEDENIKLIIITYNMFA
jgi:hypothetical protein